MATTEQIKSLIKFHIDNNDERFITTVLQVAAHEAKKGHNKIAVEMRDLIDKYRESYNKTINNLVNPFSDLMQVLNPDIKLNQLIANVTLKDRIKRILIEYRQQHKLKKHGLSNRRKILLTGPPGTGKTMTASIIAGELRLPFYVIYMDKMVTKYMGETGAKLRKIFSVIDKYKGVFLFDEFDAIGAERALDNDVGEMRRVLNAFLQFIEQDESDSFIIAATNNVKILDLALFRRFDDVVHYQLPDIDESILLIKNCLGSFGKIVSYPELKNGLNNLSHAEITKACEDSIKEVILTDGDQVPTELLLKMFKERHSTYSELR